MNFKYKSHTVSVQIKEGIFSTLVEHLPKTGKCFVVTDEVVYQLYPKMFAGFSYVHRIKSGESSKTLESVTKIITLLLENDFDRFDYMVAVGGGVVGDLTAFVASIYKRGIDVIQVPTTVISQVDSCLGGKTGVNFGKFKNQIGTLYHPRQIIIDPLVLSTLPDIEIKSGMAEIIKMAALFDEEMFVQLEQETADWKTLIKRCLELKAKITLEDEEDLGVRQLLNFGHTVGHAIEAKCHLPHGVAVGYGMVLESKNERIKQLLEKYGYDFSVEFTGLEEYIQKDKKRKDQTIQKVVIEKIGQSRLEEVSIDEYFS